MYNIDKPYLTDSRYGRKVETGPDCPVRVSNVGWSGSTNQGESAVLNLENGTWTCSWAQDSYSLVSVGDMDGQGEPEKESLTGVTISIFT